jgi:DNA transformation protein and related proteins
MLSKGEAMPSANKEFALYCCDLLAGVGPCVAKSMFGGWGISTDGLTIALMTNLGQGDKLWLKASDDSKACFVAAGCQQFMYPMKGPKGIEMKGMNYYTAPDDAMESPALMLPWARLALQAALTARNAKATKPRRKPAAVPLPDLPKAPRKRIRKPAK